MKVNVLKSSKRELKIEVVGEGHSFCNALNHFISKSKGVEFAGYRIQHPLISSPTIYMRMNTSKRPKTALLKAAKSLGREVGKLRKKFEDELKDK